MRVVFASEAKADLADIGDYIARDNPGRARSFLAELKRAANSLARFPNRYPLLPRHESTGLRRRVYGHYHIVYLVDSRQVDVVRILHAARDYEALLLPDE